MRLVDIFQSLKSLYVKCGEQIEYSRITLDDVMVTGVEFDGSKNNEVLWVTYSFQAVKIKTQYWEQTERGGKGPETQMGYDIKQNKATT